MDDKTLDPHALGDNPDFMRLPRNEQHKVMSQSFPEYAGLPSPEQEKVLDRVTRRDLPSRPAGLPAGMTLPGFPSPMQSASEVMNRTVPGRYGKDSTFASSNGKEALLQDASDARNFAMQAGRNVRDTAKGAWSGAKQFYHDPVGTEVGKVVTTPFSMMAGALDNVGGSADRMVHGHPVDGASQLLGGDPDKAAELERQGDAGGAVWERFGKPAALAAVSEGAARGLTRAQGFFAGPLEGPRANDAFASWISGGVKGDVLPQEVAANVRPIFKQAAQNIGLKDENFLQRTFTGDTPTRGPAMTANGPIRRTVEGMKKGVDLAKEAVRIADAPMDAVMKQAAGDVVDPGVRKSIVDGLMAKAAEADKVDAGGTLSKAYRKLAESTNGVKTYGELNDLKRYANNMMEGAPAGSISAEIASATKPVQAWKDFGGLVRDNMYPALQDRYIPKPGQPGYFDVRDMGRREAQVLDARDGVMKGYRQAGQLDAPHGAQTAPEKATEGSMYKTHVLKRVLGVEPSPAGKFNKTMRRGLGEIGKGGESETVQVVPKNVDIARRVQETIASPEYKAASNDVRRAMLDKVSRTAGKAQLPPPNFPPPPSGPQFDVSLPGNPESATRMTDGLSQEYVGQRQVPNPQYSPMTGPSHFQQKQELGSTATTIPDRTRGAQSPSRKEADQVGLGHDPNRNRTGIPAPPTRAFTGPETVSESNFQTKMGALEPAGEATKGTRGVLRTHDPAVAQKALEAMDAHMDSPQFTGSRKDLEKQLASAKDPATRRELSRQLDTLHQTQFEARAGAEKLRRQLQDYRKTQGAQRPAEFEVHWTPTKPPTLKGRTTGAGKRAIAQAGRAVTQGGRGTPLLGPPPASAQDEEEEQKAMEAVH